MRQNLGCKPINLGIADVVIAKTSRRDRPRLNARTDGKAGKHHAATSSPPAGGGLSIARAVARISSIRL